MSEESSPADNDDSNDRSVDEPVEIAPDGDTRRGTPSADPAQQFLTWAVIVLIVLAAIVFGASLANQEPETRTGTPVTPMTTSLR